MSKRVLLNLSTNNESRFSSARLFWCKLKKETCFKKRNPVDWCQTSYVAKYSEFCRVSIIYQTLTCQLQNVTL